MVVGSRVAKPNPIAAYDCAKDFQMRSLNMFQASTIHPGSWWILGFSLAVASGMTNQIWVALLISLAAISLAGLLRTEAPWAR